MVHLLTINYLTNIKIMNIYLLARTDRWSYDDYDAFVVAAESEDEAKQMNVGYGSTAWATPNNIKATLLGVAAEGISKGEILGSFNAG